MSSKYYGDLMYSTSEYEKDGEKKKRWQKSGAVFQNEDGRLSVKFETMPFGIEFSGWMQIFKRDDKDSNKPMTQAQALNGGKDVVVDDIDGEPIDISKIPF